MVVGEEHVTLSVDGDADRAVQSSLGGRASVSRVALIARPCDRGDDAVFVDLADSLVLRIGDIDVPIAVVRDVVGGQLRLGSRAVTPSWPF